MPSGDAISNPAKESTKQKRCPECGQDAASGKPAHIGFWRDPARWMVTLLAAVLIGAQISAVWWAPWWFTQQPVTDRNDLLGCYYADGTRLTWADIRIASQESGWQRARLRSCLTQTRCWGQLHDVDPAATIVVDNSWVPAPSRQVDQSRVLLFGTPTPWLHLHKSDYDPRFPLSMATSIFRVSWPMGSQGQWYSAWVFPTEIAISAARCMFAMWLCSVLSRPLRPGSARRGMRKYWLLAAVSLMAALAALPPLPVSSAYQEMRMSWSGTPKLVADSALSLREAWEAADSDDAAARFARRLVDAIDSGVTSSIPAADENVIAVAVLTSKTRSTVTQSYFGWPGPCFLITIQNNDPPVGVPASQGRIRFDRYSSSYFGCTFNAGAWPGTVTSIAVNFLELLPNLLLTVLLCWLFRCIIRARIFFRTRRRAAAGLCVHCGYDLKGIKPR